MKRSTWVLPVLLCLGAAGSSAQGMATESSTPEMVRVAILPYRNRTEVDSLDVFEEMIRQAIANRLMATGKVLIVPQEEVASVMDTLVPELGYLTNERQAFRLGNAVNASKVVFGSFTRSGDVINIKTYVVDCRAMSVHTIEQAELRFQAGSDHVGAETARVVQGQIVGVTPTGSAPQRTVVPHAPGRRSSPAFHVEPWATLGATVGLVYLTYHYDAKASEAWDDYRRAVREHEITRLYGKATDYLLARNLLAALSTASLAVTVHYWFAHDFGTAEEWSQGPRSGQPWLPSVVIGAREVALTMTKRF